MNSTSINDSFVLIYESWFLPIDVITNVCILIGIILALVFFIFILHDKTCHTVPMLLVGNSCFIGIIFGIVMYAMNLFKLLNDVQQNVYRDFFCNCRGYLGYATCSILNFSYFLQAMYRYVRVVYPNRLFYQTAKFQLLLIVLTWLFGIFYPFHFLFTGEILYDIRNQICQLPLHLSFSIIYMANFAYMTPVALTFIVYMKLVYYVKKMGKRITPANVLSRAKKDLQMVKRTVVLVSILIIYCLPYAVFIFLSFIITIPTYHFRISYVFIDASYLFVMIILFQFTDPLKTSIKRKFLRPQNDIAPTVIATIIS